jgi:hypothetical protein
MCSLNDDKLVDRGFVQRSEHEWKEEQLFG